MLQAAKVAGILYMAGKTWVLRSCGVVLCAVVSGCGDGGGSVASAGSSAPPSGTNSNLLGTLQTESFANQAAQASLSIANSSASGTIGQPAATFVYDATAKSYTVNVGGKSQTFTPTMINASLSSSTATLYETTTGTATESLTLTKPGTSGHFTYEYVGGAFWEDLNLASSTNGSGTVTAFAYGEPTVATAVPTNGQGLYNLDLFGIESHGNAALPTAFIGNGAMQVNFATGAIELGGTIAGVANGGFSSSSTLSSGG